MANGSPQVRRDDLTDRDSAGFEWEEIDTPVTSTDHEHLIAPPKPAAQVSNTATQIGFGSLFLVLPISNIGASPATMLEVYSTVAAQECCSIHVLLRCLVFSTRSRNLCVATCTSSPSKDPSEHGEPDGKEEKG